MTPLFRQGRRGFLRFSALIFFSVSVFVDAATFFARNVPHPSGRDGALGPSGLPAPRPQIGLKGVFDNHYVITSRSMCVMNLR